MYWLTTYAVIGLIVLLLDHFYIGRSGKWPWYFTLSTDAICFLFWPIVYPIFIYLFIRAERLYQKERKAFFERNP